MSPAGNIFFSTLICTKNALKIIMFVESAAYPQCKLSHIISYLFCFHFYNTIILFEDLQTMAIE